MASLETIGPLINGMKKRPDTIGLACEAINRMFQKEQSELVAQVSNFLYSYFREGNIPNGFSLIYHWFWLPWLGRDVTCELVHVQFYIWCTHIPDETCIYTHRKGGPATKNLTTVKVFLLCLNFKFWLFTKHLCLTSFVKFGLSFLKDSFLFIHSFVS